MKAQNPRIKTGGKHAGSPQADGNPTDIVHSMLESSLNSLYADVNDWFTTHSESTSPPGGASSTTASSALSVTNPRPSRLGLGATPAQTRALLSAEERRLRERILGATSTSRKRRGEFDHEVDLVKSLNKKAKTSDSDVPVRKGHAASNQGHDDPDSLPDSDDDESSKTRAVAFGSALTDSEGRSLPAPASPEKPAKPPLAHSKNGSPADMLSAYLGGKSKKRRKKQNTGVAQGSDTMHPAIHPALLRSNPVGDT
ncbi:hypothetical protein BCR44DRAFT_34173 [Catenaria anguillulae PL171]|uniref:Uncharacterized protein n=1 Tax=Catenaria anguillulae PL171 TaxID=765915 RepID=A0A1Y2HLC1_9FUNG|nr:hypothetical protein BCR44DRAFT_34173 [Catenaria anguillulae PL171]